MTIWAILPAAGIGRRMGSSIPKQYLPLDGKTVIQHSLARLCATPAIATVLVALHPEDDYFSALDVADPRVETVPGGEERQHSVLNALEALAGRAQDSDWVLVHDAVRPCVLSADIERLLHCIENHEVGGLLAIPQDNTLKQADDQGLVERTVDRSRFWQAFTPQAFRYGLLRDALRSAIGEQRTVTDEASAVEAMGYKPLLVQGDKHNIKITHEADLALAEFILQRQGEPG